MRTGGGGLGGPGRAEGGMEMGMGGWGRCCLPVCVCALGPSARAKQEGPGVGDGPQGCPCARQAVVGRVKQEGDVRISGVHGGRDPPTPPHRDPKRDPSRSCQY